MQHLKAEGLKRYCYAVVTRPAVIGHMQTLRAEGRSYHAIAEALNLAGIPTEVKGRWRGNTVRRVLLRVRAEAAAQGRSA